jgi:hypothetical protein
MIGRLSSVVIDCRDPHGLAHFYSELLGPDLSVLPYDPRWFLYRGLAHLAGHPVCLTRRLIWGTCRRRCRRKLPERPHPADSGCRALT